MKNKNLLVLVAVWTLLFWVTSATSDYMHYQTVNGIGTISICDPTSSGTKCITMQDKNLWASEAWVWCINYANYCYAWVQYYSDMEECLANDNQLGCMWWEYFWNLFTDEEDCNDRWQSLYEACMAEQGTWMYWKHFQWWNNHWFEIGCFTYWYWCTDTVTNSATGTLALWSPEYNHVWYNWATFIKWTSSSRYDYWSDNTPSNHNWLRWWENDTAENNYWFDETWNVAINATWRRWPCDIWYHVPSIWEWNQVLKYWAEENGIELEDDGGLKSMTLDVLKFQEDFKIPFAGFRISYEAKVCHMEDHANFWSSSPRVGFTQALRFTLLSPGRADLVDYYNRADALSLRCFKDSYLSFPTNENGDSGSGSASTHVTLTLTAWSNTCTLNDYNLGTHNASAEEQYIESSWQEILCEFLQNTWVRVLLSMGDLTDWSKLIWAENFTWVVTAIGNSLWSISNLTWWNYNLSWSQEIYWKAENTLWKWTWDLQIIWTIPAWTPSGTYTWSLEIVIQEG